MAQVLPADLIPRATGVLMPRFSSADERGAWLAQAFYLTDPRLYEQLKGLSGVPIVAVTQTITALLSAGCLPGRGIHALAQLLGAIKLVATPDEQSAIDTLAASLNPLCGEAPTQPVTLNPTTPTTPLQSIDTPETERTPTVFISYSHVDEAFVTRLITDIQAAGHAVWIDTVSIKGGEAWVKSIADGVRNSYAFVTVISPQANISRWVLREYLLADELGKLIFPLMAVKTDVPFQMIDRQVIFMHEDYLGGLADLVSYLPPPMVMVPPAPQAVIVPPPAPAPAPAPSAPPARAVKPLPSDPEPQAKSSGSLFDRIPFPRKKKADKPAELEETRRDEAPAAAEPVWDADDEMVWAADGESDEFGGSASEAEPEAIMSVDWRAEELGYLSRLQAVGFDIQQDAPDDSEPVRWLKLSADAVLDIPDSVWETGEALLPMDSAAPMMHAETPRMLLDGADAQDAHLAVWTVVHALARRAAADLSQPIPLVVDLSGWDASAQTLSARIAEQSGTLSAAVDGLLTSGRAALIFHGLRGLDSVARAALRAFLTTHPTLPAVIDVSA